MAWVWTDDLIRRLTPVSGQLPPHVRRWIEAPIALRVAEDADEDTIAALVGIAAPSSTHRPPARTIAAAIPPCRCDAGDEEPAMGVGAPGSGG